MPWGAQRREGGRGGKGGEGRVPDRARDGMLLGFGGHAPTRNGGGDGDRKCSPWCEFGGQVLHVNTRGC